MKWLRELERIRKAKMVDLSRRKEETEIKWQVKLEYIEKAEEEKREEFKRLTSRTQGHYTKQREEEIDCKSELAKNCSIGYCGLCDDLFALNKTLKTFLSKFGLAAKNKELWSFPDLGLSNLTDSCVKDHWKHFEKSKTWNDLTLTEEEFHKKIHPPSLTVGRRFFLTHI